MNLGPPKQAEDLMLEKQLKFVKERFDETEDAMASLCSAFSEFTRRSAKYRDSNDQIAVALNGYASKEQINLTLKNCLDGLAESLARLGDHRDHSTMFLEEQVMTSMIQYANLSRRAQAQIKEISSAKDRELSKRRQLTKIRQRFPQNMKIIMKAESDLVEAASKVGRMQSALEEYAIAFEKTRLDDLKRVLHDFLKAELAFHVGALECLSKASAAVVELNVDADCQAFKSILHRPGVAVRLEVVRNHEQNGTRIGGGIPKSSSDETKASDPVVAPSDASIQSSKETPWLSGLESSLRHNKELFYSGADVDGDSSEDSDDDEHDGGLYSDEASESVIHVKPTIGNC
ncbi:DUF1208 [Nesidiocoris tenuis]|uniref:DUF1208 n=1 Tax=Nesidiocoris tenuis TaxID=355587 RepID=A0ABN7AFS4_9HEMI|nr:DUF1208 [Nesidiocoris tenuis]